MVSIYIIFIWFAVFMFFYTAILFFVAKNDLRRFEKIKSVFMWGIVGIVFSILAYLIEVIIKSI